MLILLQPIKTNGVRLNNLSQYKKERLIVCENQLILHVKIKPSFQNHNTLSVILIVLHTEFLHVS